MIERWAIKTNKEKFPNVDIEFSVFKENCSKKNANKYLKEFCVENSGKVVHVCIEEVKEDIIFGNGTVIKNIKSDEPLIGFSQSSNHINTNFSEPVSEGVKDKQKSSSSEAPKNTHSTYAEAVRVRKRYQITVLHEGKYVNITLKKTKGEEMIERVCL